MEYTQYLPYAAQGLGLGLFLGLLRWGVYKVLSQFSRAVSFSSNL